MTKKILIIGPNWIGDMIMAQCLVFEILKQHPKAQIDLFAPSLCLEATLGMPQITNRIASPFSSGAFEFKKRREIGKKLQNKYHQAYILPNSFKSALIPFFAKIKTRTGFCGEMRFGLINDIRFLDTDDHPLMIQRYSYLAHPRSKKIEPGEISQPKMRVDKEKAQALAKKYGVDQSDKPVLALCPGAAYGPSKRWPAKYFAKLAELQLNKGYEIWLLGAKNDIKSCELINKANDGQLKNFAGKIPLKESIALLSLCDTIVCNDSGLMHISAALGKKVIAIFGSSSPSHTPPLSKDAVVMDTLDLPCKPCFKRVCPLSGDKHLKCLLDITPEQVAKSIQ